MPPPKNLRQVQSFFGRLNYISRFIAQLTHTLPANLSSSCYARIHPWNGFQNVMIQKKEKERSSTSLLSVD